MARLPSLRGTISDPRKAGARILSWSPSVRIGIEAVALVAALGGLLFGVETGGGLDIPDEAGAVVLGPFGYALLLLAALALTGLAVAVAGRALGGGGRVGEALALMAWLQVLDLVLHAGTLVVALLVPPLAGIAVILRFGLVLWCFLGFVQALHGFGPGRSAAAILVGGLGLGLALTVLLAVLGVGAPPDV